MTKSFRQGQILKLIRSRSISTQEELGRALREVEIEATQEPFPVICANWAS